MFWKILADIRKFAARTRYARLHMPESELWRHAAWLPVLLLHLGLIWILARAVAMPVMAGADGIDLQVSLLASPRADSGAKLDAVPEPQMQPADARAVDAPNIAIDPNAIDATAPGGADVLPPRPDPAHPNTGPVLPKTSAPTAKSAQVTLTILVDANGGVADARVARSCGEATLDELAATFAKEKWRFKAATQNGKPVADWTTVVVRFLNG
jgi:TonB family protein